MTGIKYFQIMYLTRYLDPNIYSHNVITENQYYKRAEDLNWNFSQEDTWMSKKLMKWCSILLIIRKIQIETSIRNEHVAQGISAYSRYLHNRVLVQVMLLCFWPGSLLVHPGNQMFQCYLPRDYVEFQSPRVSRLSLAMVGFWGNRLEGQRSLSLFFLMSLLTLSALKVDENKH